MELENYRKPLLDAALHILGIDSPSGYTAQAMEAVAGYAREYGYPFEMNNKGCGIITLEGVDNSRTVALTAHVDTLGAMVRSITKEGGLKFTCVGGPILPTLDGEYCKIRTRSGQTYTGTLLSESPAAHVHPDSATRARSEETMMVRIDERVRSREEVQALGIRAGDYIFFDPKAVVTGSGFLKSRFIDDKGSVAILMTLLRLLREKGVRPKYRTLLYLSAYEEVGHGAASLPQGVCEMLAVDMGCIGLDLGCTEYDVSICAKDSTGPYDYALTSRLIALAQENGIPFAVDIYPRYGSDVGAARSAGHDVRGALIGPGVHASHGMERTHSDAMLATLRLLTLYLEVQ